MRTFILAVTMAFVWSTVGVAEELTDVPQNTAPRLKQFLVDKNFECVRTSKPSIVEFATFKACVGQFKCRFSPTIPPSPSSLPKKDSEETSIACKVSENGTCPTISECSEAGAKEVPGAIQIGHALVPKRLANGERSPKFGTCKYPFRDGGATQLVGIRGKDDYEIVCATPFTCTGGNEAPPVTVAACEPEYFTEVKVEDPKTRTSKMIEYPVCAGPVTCLEKSLKVEMAPANPKEKNAVGFVPHKKALPAIEEAFAQTTGSKNGRQVLQPAHGTLEPRI